MLDLSFRPEDCMEEFVLKYENRLYRTAIAIGSSRLLLNRQILTDFL
jgi:hypothetical protein